MATQQPRRPGKPRLSLKIQTPSTSSTPSVSVPQTAPPTRDVSSRHVPDQGDNITAFNTLTNTYATAIQRSTPLTAINTFERLNLTTPASQNAPDRITTPYLTTSYPETPLSATEPAAPPSALSAPSRPVLSLPSMSTPPMSGTRDDTRVFTYPSSSLPQNQEATTVGSAAALPPPPYTQPRVLRSILRNSPLPPRTAIPPPSPRRQSMRLREKAARRVAYNSPLEQEIVTSVYTKSCIDLLYSPGTPSSGGSSPYGMSSASPTAADRVLDHALAPTTRDGGQTPGPFEETRRRMTRSSSSSSPSSPSGIRKRRGTGAGRKDRRWVWTTNVDDEEENDDEVGGAVAALRAAKAREDAAAKAVAEAEAKAEAARVEAAKAAEAAAEAEAEVEVEATPTPSIESCGAWSEDKDVEMTDASSVVSEVAESEVGSVYPESESAEAKTPTVPAAGPKKNRDTPIPELATDSQRATPIPVPLVPTPEVVEEGQIL